jgi:hypothetical protein
MFHLKNSNGVLWLFLFHCFLVRTSALFFTPIMHPNKPAETTDRLIRPIGRFSAALFLHQLIGEERE